ncbi:MAG: hypothetical protein KJO13_03995 [Gammaproteobacteria bacterium]|nr:hypothetical protein [Gammaproteobacteria bacterium]
MAAGAVGVGLSGWPGEVWAADDPIWRAIPDQTWAVGVPVYLDLSAYASSQIGAELLFTINQSLPDGVSLNGTVIRGTPTGTFSRSGYVVTAQDGQIIDATPPDNPTDVTAQ